MSLTPNFSEIKLLETINLIFPDTRQSQLIKQLKIVCMFRNGQFGAVNFKNEQTLKVYSALQVMAESKHFSFCKSNVCTCEFQILPTEYKHMSITRHLYANSLWCGAYIPHKQW